jgi:cell filamentation protein
VRVRATALAELVDPYVDPETGLLRNKIGARTKVALDKAEGDLSFARLVQLMDHPLEATRDLEELRAIHRQLFQDVYDWAGQPRTVDMRKNVEGAEHFLRWSMIGRAAGYAAEQLRQDNGLRGMGQDRFVDRLAYHYEQFNYVHPFREGNGRAQRVFWNRVARDAGWQIDWRSVRGSTNDEACRAASEQNNFGPLREMFGRIVIKATPAAERDDAWGAAELARLSFPTGAAVAVQRSPDEPSSPPPGPRAYDPDRRYGSTSPREGR